VREEIVEEERDWGMSIQKVLLNDWCCHLAWSAQAALGWMEVQPIGCPKTQEAAGGAKEGRKGALSPVSPLVRSNRVQFRTLRQPAGSKPGGGATRLEPAFFCLSPSLSLPLDFRGSFCFPGLSNVRTGNSSSSRFPRDVLGQEELPSLRD